MSIGFEESLLLELEKDKKNLQKECDSLNKEHFLKIDEYNKELEIEKKALEKNKKHLESLLSITKKEYKENKKLNKQKRKESKIKINDDIIKVSKIRAKITKEKDLINKNELSYKEKINLLIQHIDKYLSDTLIHDKYIINLLTISSLKTKIKIIIKEYNIEKIPSNPRVGMSLGTNFKPRVFVSTNAKTRTKKVITRNETFEIHSNDNPKIRLKEISDYLGIINPENLISYFYENLKKHQGQQYIDNFFKRGNKKEN